MVWTLFRFLDWLRLGVLGIRKVSEVAFVSEEGVNNHVFASPPSNSEHFVCSLLDDIKPGYLIIKFN